MLLVRFDPTRPVEEGQFEVTLTDLNHAAVPQENFVRNKTSYWCDDEHLHAWLTEIVRELTLSDSMGK